jgi:UTP--glucose-1-phosphate uridylyltransferase
MAAGIDEIGMVVHPGDEDAFREAAGLDGRRLTFLPQQQPLGYGHAVHCAAEFADGEPVLHVVGDHVYVCPGNAPAKAIVALAEQEDCSVSAVQPTRETQLSQYGAVAGTGLTGRPDVYRIETVIEKPTPTEAEQRLVVPGLRAGYYLCFFGMHVLTPAVFDILRELLGGGGRIGLSEALAELARREQYLALVSSGQRYDLGARYGFLTAQLALGLHGCDSAEVLARVLETVASTQQVSGAARA